MAISYKLVNDPIKGTPAPIIKKTEDGASSFIPKDEANTDYQEYLEWVAEGNTAEAAD